LPTQKWNFRDRTALSNDGGWQNTKWCVGDTTFLDYGSKGEKKAQLVRWERSAQCFLYRTAEWSILGLVIAKLWNRAKPQDETPTQNKDKPQLKKKAQTA